MSYLLILVAACHRAHHGADGHSVRLMLALVAGRNTHCCAWRDAAYLVGKEQ